MSYEVFSNDWAAAWAQELENSEVYRAAAATWEGSLALAMTSETQNDYRAVFVDLWHGDCRAARQASSTDLEQADFLIRADLATWKRVMDGDLDPMFGLMSGKLKLARGSLAKLTPYLNASRELVKSATRIDSVFPAEGGSAPVDVASAE